MPEKPPADMLQAFDEAAYTVLARLIADHRQAALATRDLAGEQPHAAMVAYVPEPGFAGFLLHLSELAAHKRHLRAMPLVGLLIFEPDDGRGEVLQRKRVSLDCHAELIPRDSADYAAARARYLARLPGHQIMFTLGDFDLVRLRPSGGLLNAGFGRAYRVRPEDLGAAAERV